MKTELTKTALMKATDLLARQDQSERLLRQKLAARQYSEAEIEEAIETLKARNYLDNEATCGRQFERLYSGGKLSLSQIYAKLMHWGFETTLINRLVPEDTDEHERSAALHTLTAKYKYLPEDKKMWQYLSVRGFDGEAITFAIDAFKKNFETTNE